MTNTNFKYFKIFGERNTGTNFLNRLILNNTNLLSMHPLRTNEEKEKDRTETKTEVKKTMKLLSLDGFFDEKNRFYFRFFKNNSNKKQTIYNYLTTKVFSNEQRLRLDYNKEEEKYG